MNILLTLNSYFLKYAIVMLHSLFTNTNVKINVYILQEDLTAGDKNEIENEVKIFGNSVHFIQIDSKKFAGFPTTDVLPKECYFICLAHETLPQEMSRILYLDADIIVDGDISELYNMEFDGKSLIACGQTFEKVDGNYYRTGAQAERGELFNSGVMVFNLDKMRRDVTIDGFKKIAKKNSYQWQLADQGLFNIFFENDVKIIGSFKYNFRIALLEEYVRTGNSLPETMPLIYHFTMRDYYRIGRPVKPWQLMLSNDDELRFYNNGFQNRPYDYRQVDNYRKKSFDLWWTYARKTFVYKRLLDEHTVNKETILHDYFKGGRELEEKKVETQRRTRAILKGITENKFEDEYGKLTYAELERYIDEIDKEEAIRTMENLFSYNAEILMKRKTPIKIGFFVYSSAEWQCERLYRLLEEDSYFDPWIVVCAYGHGTPDSVREAYIRTSEYFRRAGTYQIEYAGYCNRWVPIGFADAYDICIYFTPYDNLLPSDLFIGQRLLKQLPIHITYGEHLVAKDDTRYSGAYFDYSVFKLSYKYFAEYPIIKDIIASDARMGAYNVEVSGQPKLDELVFKTYEIRADIWKNNNKDAKRIIWAPHFNLMKGMNGTFHENCRWFLEFAKKHKEISWIVRPHPRMLIGTLEKGVFKDNNEYYAYFQEWRDLPNANVLESGAYFDMFDTSSALIHDCGSFLAEYMYTGKPQLQLLPEYPRAMNLLGKEIQNNVYSSRGNDYSKIEDFIYMIIEEKDPMKEERLRLIEDKLDYRNFNGGISASEYIANVFKRDFVDEGICR